MWETPVAMYEGISFGCHVIMLWKRGVSANCSREPPTCLAITQFMVYALWLEKGIKLHQSSGQIHVHLARIACHKHTYTHPHTSLYKKKLLSVLVRASHLHSYACSRILHHTAQAVDAGRPAACRELRMSEMSFRPPTRCLHPTSNSASLQLIFMTKIHINMHFLEKSQHNL